MPQLTVCRNRNAATKARFPLLLDVQTGLLGELGTQVVIPLAPATAATRRAALQTFTPQLASIGTRELGPAVADLSGERPAILAALDLLITGI